MTFDKEKYWERRSIGVRGQGHTARPSHIYRRIAQADTSHDEPSTKPLSKYAIRKNTKRARKYAQREVS